MFAIFRDIPAYSELFRLCGFPQRPYRFIEIESEESNCLVKTNLCSLFPQNYFEKREIQSIVLSRKKNVQKTSPCKIKTLQGCCGMMIYLSGNGIPKSKHCVAVQMGQNNREILDILILLIQKKELCKFSGMHTSGE